LSSPCHIRFGAHVEEVRTSSEREDTDMLAVKSYPAEYVDRWRTTLRGDIAAFEALGLSAAQRAGFEPRHAAHLVLVLDHLFTHRMRGQEGTGTLAEVRALCDRIREGDAPAMTLAEVSALCDRFLAEVEERFPAAVPV
jgi:hypothetical protein